MNQPTDEQQDRMEENNTKSLSQRKKRGVQAVIIAAAALIATPVLAWLFMQRSMETMTQINNAICTAHRSRRCETSSAAGTQ